MKAAPEIDQRSKFIARLRTDWTEVESPQTNRIRGGRWRQRGLRFRRRDRERAPHRWVQILDIALKNIVSRPGFGHAGDQALIIGAAQKNEGKFRPDRAHNFQGFKGIKFRLVVIREHQVGDFPFEFIAQLGFRMNAGDVEGETAALQFVRDQLGRRRVSF